MDSTALWLLLGATNRLYARQKPKIKRLYRSMMVYIDTI